MPRLVTLTDKALRVVALGNPALAASPLPVFTRAATATLDFRYPAHAHYLGAML